MDDVDANACVSCDTTSETYLGIQGDEDWHIRVLGTLGLPWDDAYDWVNEEIDSGRHEITSGGRFTVVYPLCPECATRVSGYPAPALWDDDEPVPIIGQP